MSKNLINRIPDDEVPSGMFDIFKKGKVQCRIIYEDGSYKDYYKKFGRSYTMDIKGRTYFVDSRCIIRGKRPFICWFFNNPMPINYDYQPSKVSAKELVEKSKLKMMSDKERQISANIVIDSEGLNSAFNTRLMQGLYAGNGLTTKSLIIILVVICVIILVILQATGTIDIQSMIS